MGLVYLPTNIPGTVMGDGRPQKDEKSFPFTSKGYIILESNPKEPLLKSHSKKNQPSTNFPSTKKT